jgi:bisphosphoglycerate-dependent phosphoglycerate mutase
VQRPDRKPDALKKVNVGRAARWMHPRRSHACGSGERKYRCVLNFIKKPRRTKGGAEEAYWTRSLSKPEKSHPDGTRLNGRPYASIIGYQKTAKRKQQTENDRHLDKRSQRIKAHFTTHRS